MQKVFDSFAFCEFFIDHKNKKLDISYPDGDERSMDPFEFMFAASYLLGPYLILTVVLQVAMMKVVSWYIGTGLMALEIGYFAVLWHYRRAHMRKLILVAGEMKQWKKKATIKAEKMQSTQVVLTNVGNYLTEYRAVGDCARKLEYVHMRCLGIKEDAVKARYRWELVVQFTDVPADGFVEVINERSILDCVDARKNPVVHYNESLRSKHFMQRENLEQVKTIG